MKILVVKNGPANAGDIRDTGSVPGSGRSPGGEHGNPLQYSCLENPTDRGAWRAIVPGAATGDPTHDRVMWKRTVKQGFRTQGGSLSFLKHLPQNQNLSVLLVHDFHQLL